ncbi:pilus assembly protein [Sphingomonas sinipercae]|uniref:Pilus assembly protein n=1 Tax=Sphingomonas sinipercae TaxID=2714944 RepID=A0A6G7ZN38_9SPHN|nr:TadE family protein [Sphingomonas sinipercae]QIL02353.1 pilus assembly protein [Sphingomonas sinipercae]
MKLRSGIIRHEEGATVVELAFALPILIAMLWMIIQLGMVFRAMSGIHHALGEGARAATIWPVPEKTAIVAKMNSAVWGIGPGKFSVSTPVDGTADGSTFMDLQVNYEQKTNLLLFPGPTVKVSRSKRVWVAEAS